MANTVGSGKCTYELLERFGTLPSGWTFGPVSAVATDSKIAFMSSNARIRRC